MEKLDLNSKKIDSNESPLFVQKLTDRLKELAGIKQENTIISDSSEKNKDYKEKFKKILLDKNIDSEYYGSGMRGYAYKSGDKIYKFTKDPIEIDSAQKTIGKNLQHVVKYYSIEPIEGDWYLLKMDYLDKLTEVQEEVIELIQNSLGVAEYMLDPERRRKFIKELTMYPDYYEYIGVDLKTIKNILEQLLLIYQECIQNNLSTNDIRVDNLGVKNGKIVHFDLGAG